MPKIHPRDMTYQQASKFEWVNIPDNNQPTEPTTISIASSSYIHGTIVIPSCIDPLMIYGLKDGKYSESPRFNCSDELAYWLYNKDVPIPVLPKCVSSRIHAPSRGWRNGGKGKTAPIVDSGWNKEKL